MKSRLFKNYISTNAAQDTSIEWHKVLTKNIEAEIIRIHIQAFSEAYANYAEADLNLKPGINKNDFIRSLIAARLSAFENGHHHLATISIHHKICGFVMCAPVKSRHHELKNDLFVSLLAVKPLRNVKSEKIQLGLGKQLMQSVMHRFEDANTIILDTRRINSAAIEFYHKLGFKPCHPFDDEPLTYIGFEKSSHQALSKYR